MSGIAKNAGDDRYIFILTSLLINCTVWQFKLKKIIPSIASIVSEVDSLFESVTLVSESVRTIAGTNASPLCRRWTAARHGRG
jgi:hypothetical protein